MAWEVSWASSWAGEDHTVLQCHLTPQGLPLHHHACLQGRGGDELPALDQEEGGGGGGAGGGEGGENILAGSQINPFDNCIYRIRREV